MRNYILEKEMYIFFIFFFILFFLLQNLEIWPVNISQPNDRDKCKFCKMETFYFQKATDYTVNFQQMQS